MSLGSAPDAGNGPSEQANEQADTCENQSDPSSSLSPRGTAAAQGEEPLNWTAHDGSRIHGPYAEAVQEELEDLDANVVVTPNVPVVWKAADGSIQSGAVDTLIETGDRAIVLDYKTNDMSGWSVADATRHGKAHGQQVEQYVGSLDMPDATQGFIIASGRPPILAEAQAAYVSAAAGHGVGVTFTTDGDPQAVARAARSIFEQGHG